MEKTPGRRIQWDARGNDILLDLEPGDYAWMGTIDCGYIAVCAPNGDFALLETAPGRGWKAVEEPDGTVTVTPSIRWLSQKKYHGTLTKGVWQTEEDSGV